MSTEMDTWNQQLKLPTFLCLRLQWSSGEISGYGDEETVVMPCKSEIYVLALKIRPFR